MSCRGNPGHGSRFIEGTAAEKLRRVINRFLDFRQQEKSRLESNPQLTLGDVTSINLTKVEVKGFPPKNQSAKTTTLHRLFLKGGVQVNVVPSELVAYFDIRVTPLADKDEMLNQLYQWCKEAGDDVQLEFGLFTKGQSLTSVEPGNIW